MNTDNVVEFLRQLSLDVSLAPPPSRPRASATRRWRWRAWPRRTGCLQRGRLVRIHPWLPGRIQRQPDRHRGRGRGDLAAGSGSGPGFPRGSQFGYPGHRHPGPGRRAARGRPGGQRPGPARRAGESVHPHQFLKPQSRVARPGRPPRHPPPPARPPCRQSADSRRWAPPNPAFRQRRTRRAWRAASGPASAHRSSRPRRADRLVDRTRALQRHRQRLMRTPSRAGSRSACSPAHSRSKPAFTPVRPSRLCKWLDSEREPRGCVTAAITFPAASLAADPAPRSRGHRPAGDRATPPTAHRPGCPRCRCA